MANSLRPKLTFTHHTSPIHRSLNVPLATLSDFLMPVVKFVFLYEAIWVLSFVRGLNSKYKLCIV